MTREKICLYVHGIPDPSFQPGQFGDGLDIVDNLIKKFWISKNFKFQVVSFSGVFKPGSFSFSGSVVEVQDFFRSLPYRQHDEIVIIGRSWGALALLMAIESQLIPTSAQLLFITPFFILPKDDVCEFLIKNQIETNPYIFKKENLRKYVQDLSDFRKRIDLERLFKSLSNRGNTSFIINTADELVPYEVLSSLVKTNDGSFKCFASAQDHRFSRDPKEIIQALQNIYE